MTKNTMITAAMLAAAFWAASASAQVQEAAGRPAPPQEAALMSYGAAADSMPAVSLDAEEMGALCDRLNGQATVIRQRGGLRGSIERRKGGGLILRLDRLGHDASLEGAEVVHRWRVITSMIIVDAGGEGRAALGSSLYDGSCREVSKCAPLWRRTVPVKEDGGPEVKASILLFWGVR